MVETSKFVSSRAQRASCSEPKRSLQTIEEQTSTSQPSEPTCPSCGSSRVVKNGLRTLSNKTKIQVFKCPECHRRFSENYIRFVGQHGTRQLSAILQEAKKLDTVTETKTVTSDEKDLKGLIEVYHAKMELQGYKPSTIRLSYSALTVLMNRGADLKNPESVKEVIAKQTWSGNRIRNVCNAYTALLNYQHRAWEPPNYEIIRKIPFIPTEQEIDDLIAGSPNLLATFLQLLKETAMRRGEAIKTPWKDVDLERRIVMCNYPEKGSNPRIFSDLSGKLLSMLNNLPRENGMLFGAATMEKLKNQLCRTRKRLAFKLGNPRLLEIHFHTLRHWKATMMYHYKPDLLVVAEFLGHKDIENTRLYIQLEKNLFKNLPNDQFITRVAFNTEEVCKLVDVGFEYVTGEYNDGGKIFRKRK
jgi:integrase